jgi:hypothetical protein
MILYKCKENKEETREVIKMIIKDQASNGQVVNAIKSYTELTEDEKARLIIPAGQSKDDYISYQVRYNKEGKLLGVAVHELKETTEDTGIDIVDSMQLLLGSKHSKAYQAAKKRVGVTNEQVNGARVAIKIR